MQLELVKAGTYETHPAMFVLFKVVLPIKPLDELIFDIFFTTPRPNVVLKVKQGRPVPAPSGRGLNSSRLSLSRKTIKAEQQTRLGRSVLMRPIYQSLEDYKSALLLGHATPYEAGQPVVVAAGPYLIHNRRGIHSQRADSTPQGDFENDLRELHPYTPGDEITTTIYEGGLRVSLRAAHVEDSQAFSIGVVFQHTGPVDVLVLPPLELVQQMRAEYAVFYRLQDEAWGSEYPTCSRSSPESRYCNKRCREFSHPHMSDRVWKSYLAEHWLRDWDLPVNDNGWVQYSHRISPSPQTWKNRVPAASLLDSPEVQGCVKMDREQAVF